MDIFNYNLCETSVYYFNQSWKSIYSPAEQLLNCFLSHSCFLFVSTLPTLAGCAFDGRLSLITRSTVTFHSWTLTVVL